MIKLENFPVFAPERYHADIELDVQITERLENFVNFYRNGGDVCIEDFYLNLLEDQSLSPPPGGGMYLKFKDIRRQIAKLEPSILDDESSEK